MSSIYDFLYFYCKLFDYEVNKLDGIDIEDKRRSELDRLRWARAVERLEMRFLFNMRLLEQIHTRNNPSSASARSAAIIQSES